MSAEVTIAGFNPVDGMLQRAIRSADDMSPLWAEFGAQLRASNAKFFAASRSSWHVDPAYRQRKAKLGQPTRPLNATGRLRASLTGSHMAVETISKHDAVFGTNVPYAKFHPSWRLAYAGPQRRRAWERRIRSFVLRDLQGAT